MLGENTKILKTLKVLFQYIKDTIFKNNII